MNWFSTYWFYQSTLLSFSWGNPDWLYGIVLVPFLFLLRWLFNGRSRQHIELPFVSADIQHSWTSYLRFIPPIIFSFGVACILISLARPQKIVQNNDERVEGIDIILTLDVSESMLEKDFSPNRLQAAKTMVQNFIRKRQHDRIGLVVFAGEAYSLCPLTTDYEMLQEFTEQISHQLISVSGTAIGDALAVGVNRMRELTSASKVIILLSDGESTAGNLSPSIAAQLAKKFGVKVYTIAVGKGTSVDTPALKEIARLTSGKFFRAGSNETLSAVFLEIDKLEKNQEKDIKTRPMEDYYGVYINWAIVSLLVTLLLKSTFMANVFED